MYGLLCGCLENPLTKSHVNGLEEQSSQKYLTVLRKMQIIRL